MNKEFNFVYVTTNLENGKKYIGKHSTDDMFDGYYGTGELIKKAYKKYGKDLFETKIIKFFDTEDEAYDYEEFLIDESIIYDDRYYNIDLGGKGSMRGRKHKESSKKQISDKMKGRSKPPRSKEYIENFEKAMAKRRKPKSPPKPRVFVRGEEHPLYKRPRPQSVIDLCKLNNRKHPIWQSYDILFKLWKENDKPGWRKMTRLAIENGFPNTAYDKMIKQFKQDSE